MNFTTQATENTKKLSKFHAKANCKSQPIIYTIESSDDEDAFLIAIHCIVHISGRSAVALACSERLVAVGDTYSLAQIKFDISRVPLPFPLISLDIL